MKNINKIIGTIGFSLLFTSATYGQIPIIKKDSIDDKLALFYENLDVEKQVMVIDGIINDVTLFSTSFRTKPDVAKIEELMKNNNNIIFVHNHESDYELFIKWEKKYKKAKKVVKKFGKETIENRLLSEIPSTLDIMSLLSFEDYAIINQKNFSHRINMKKNDKTKHIYFGLTNEVKNNLKNMDQEERYKFFDLLYGVYTDRIHKYLSTHTKVFQLWFPKEPKVNELHYELTKDNLFFIREGK